MTVRDPETAKNPSAHIESKMRPAGWWLPSPDRMALCILFLAAAAMVAESLAKPLWLDELLTWATAALPTPYRIWRSLLMAPLSLDPPLYHWSVHYLIATLGESGISIRLISIAATLASLWFVYIFLKRTGDPIAGLLAMSIMVASGAFNYGYEARPYALVLAAAAAALLSWQNAIRGRARRVSLILFAISLAVADSCHYYSILISLPFAAGELVRVCRTRTFDWPMLAAVAVGNGVMVAFIPLLPATKAYQGTYWRGVSAGDITATYKMLFDSSATGILSLLAALAIAIAGAYWHRKSRGPAPPWGLMPEETGTLVSFALYPMIVLALSLTVTHTYAERFALPAVLGLSILLALAFRRLARSNTILLLAAGAILCSAPFHAVHSIGSGRGRQTSAFSDQAIVFNHLPNARIIMTDVALYLATQKYAPEAVRQRLVLLDMAASPTASNRKNTGQMMVLGVRVGTDLPVNSANELKQMRSPFFVVCHCSEADIGFFAGSGIPAKAGSFMGWPVFTVSTL